MKRLPVLLARSICLIAAAGGCGGEEEAATQEQSSELAALVRPPGLVMGLQHNLNQTQAGTVMFSALQSEATHRRGGDLGAPNHRGYEWWSLPDTGGDPASLKLPPGVVVALKHNVNQSGQSITAFGRDATVNGDFTNFKRQVGGDLGASSGQGYFWYESTGAGFTDWASIDTLLPKFTVVGLKHSSNQSNKAFVWNGVTFDPVKTSPVPAGFKRVVGGDLGAPNGQGYYWYEKQTGPEIVVQPTLTITLPRSIHMQFGDAGSLDKDGDCLDDNSENLLAQQLRPFVTFDSHEIARQSFEPVTVFRIYKTSSTTLHIRWLFLFNNDGGYGPGANSLCGNAHAGDNDVMDYDLSSTDGVKWKLTNMRIASKGLNFPGNNRLEVFNKTFPVVYMSGSKHHEYFNTDNDLHDSVYANFLGCDDNIDGKGAAFLVSAASFAGLSSNNVGEPGSHPPSRFVDVMSMFQNHTIWGGEEFFSSDAGTNLHKVDGTDQAPTMPGADNSCVPTGCAHSVCAVGSPLQPTCSPEAQQVCNIDPFCCNNGWDGLCRQEVPSGCN
jgi:hypothetical protein